jgi:hypothetical protein
MQSRDTWANLAQAHLALARVWENTEDRSTDGSDTARAEISEGDAGLAVPKLVDRSPLARSATAQRETRYSHPIIRSGRRRHANGSIARNAADWISRGTG